MAPLSTSFAEPAAGERQRQGGYRGRPSPQGDERGHGQGSGGSTEKGDHDSVAGCGALVDDQADKISSFHPGVGGEGGAKDRILGGALGNLLDRLFTGGVTDFIDFHWGSYHFHTFNLADSAITIGVVILAIHLVFLSDATRRVSLSPSGESE